MKTLPLNGEWILDIPDSEFRQIRAHVPGSVYHDLLETGRIPDPFDRDNEEEALRLMEHDFVYTRTFTVPKELLECDAVLLRCEGLDTLADIRINGECLGRADNMHRIWEFPCGEMLREGGNEICIRFESPTRTIREAYEKNPTDGSSDAMRGFPLIRKAHCMYGWDWGPHLPDAGIWRDISLIGVEHARISQVLIRQEHSEGKAVLRIHAETETFLHSDTKILVTAVSPEGERFTGEGADCRLEIPDPQLWWPSGYGDQPLYSIEVTLQEGELVLDSWKRKIGLRTLTIHREKDEWGESFCHRVNGVDVFAMGADYIPEDNLLPRVNRERTRKLLLDAKAAHMNTIRVWGGGYYPDDFFYDLCDELGLMVWQDFMFACAMYRLTDEFEENVTAEFRDNIRRIRHHACLALWCGNNEIESFIPQGLWVREKRQITDYIRLFEHILPKTVRAEDPDAFYWPSSPSSGGSFDEPNDEHRGDCHYWAVWHGLKPFTDYRNHLFRYASEFGFQSFPCMATIESFTRPEDRNIFSYVMEKHQRNASANGKIAEYLSQNYLYPGNLDLFVYASQLLQAQAMQYGVEHWRRHRGRCMGSLVWQLNDCWPVTSWASIDYYGRWKALHYYEKRFFAPVLISCEEEGIQTQETNVNAEPFPLKMSARLNVSNERREEFQGTVRWSLRRPDASIIQEGSASVTVPPLSALWLEKQDFSGRDPHSCYYAYELLDEEGRHVGGGTVLFCAPKHFHFEDPKLKAELEGDTITVTSGAYARSVEIQCGPDTVLEDNYFDLNAGTRKVRVIRGKAENVRVRSVYDIR